MKKYKYILIAFALILLSIFWANEIWTGWVRHYEIFAKWMKSSKVHYYPWYLWLLAGGIIFPLMNRFFEKNIKIIKTATHELTHMITGMIFLQRIKSIYVEEQGTGVVWLYGNNFTHLLTDLAPYCFPIYTFPLLGLRCLCLPTLYPVIDVIIGLTAGLHIICFKEQTSSQQSDINKHPIWFSFIYIISVWLFDIALITLSYLPKLNIFLSFKLMVIDFWHVITAIFA